MGGNGVSEIVVSLYRIVLRQKKMKANYYFTIRSIVALVLGVLLVVWPDAAINYLVITVGVLFFVPGVLSLVGYFGHKGKDVSRPAFFPVAGVGSLLLGLWLMVMPAFFVNILMYVLGFVLLLGGIQQIVFLVSARKYAAVAAGFYVVPVLLLAAGFVVLLNPFDVASAAFVVLGISCIVYAGSELFNGFLLGQSSVAPVGVHFAVVSKYAVALCLFQRSQIVFEFIPPFNVFHLFSPKIFL